MLVMTEWSRRTFLKGSVAVGATSCFGRPAQSAAIAIPDTWDETRDVVIVGSGFAGLAAAIEAKAIGADTLILEKMRKPGGNSAINGGSMVATGCPQQLKHGIDDSPTLLAKDMLAAGMRMCQPQKVALVANHALANYEWTVNVLGVTYNETIIGQEDGHSVARYVVTKNGTGRDIVTKMLDKVANLGAELRLSTYVEHLYRDDEGRIVGLQVREGWQFPNKDSGVTKTIRVKKGIVLCYGGFAADVRYRTMLDPKLTKAMDTTNQPGATAELWRETSRIGCAQVHNDWIQCTPWNSPAETGMGLGWTFSQSGAAEYGLWVSTSGKRFVNELANRKVRSDAILAQEAHGFKAYALCNEPNLQAYRASRPGLLEDLVKRGIVKVYPMLTDVAGAMKIPASMLRETVDRFNEAVVNQYDPDFNRSFNRVQVPLVQGPWYVAQMSPKVHHCMGGLVTDLQCRVLDISSSLPIPGLFAAGEATSGVHGAVRLGACATLDCLVNGRIAGREAATRAST